MEYKLQDILDCMKESIGIMEEMLEEGDLDGYDIEISRSYQRVTYLSDISYQMETAVNKLMRRK